MKMLILFILICNTTLASVISLDNASKLDMARLTKYLVVNGYVEQGADISEALDDDYLRVSSVICSDGETYDYLKVYSGDTEHGPLYKRSTLELIGENSDGDFFSYKLNDYIECN